MELKVKVKESKLADGGVEKIDKKRQKKGKTVENKKEGRNRAEGKKLRISHILLPSIRNITLDFWETLYTIYFTVSLFFPLLECSEKYYISDKEKETYLLGSYNFV